MMTTLYAVEIPREGGDTEFANTGMAYSALSTEVKRRVAGLRVAFCWGARRPGRRLSAACGRESRESSIIRSSAPIPKPVSRRSISAITRRTSWGGRLPKVERCWMNSWRMQRDAEFVYTHRWRVGDLVMWDNRCLLHRVVANFQMDKAAACSASHGSPRHGAGLTAEPYGGLRTGSLFPAALRRAGSLDERAFLGLGKA